MEAAASHNFLNTRHRDLQKHISCCHTDMMQIVASVQNSNHDTHHETQSHIDNCRQGVRLFQIAESRCPYAVDILYILEIYTRMIYEVIV